MSPSDQNTHDLVTGLVFMTTVVLIVYWTQVVTRPKKVVIKPLSQPQITPKLYKIRKNVTRLCNPHIVLDRRKGMVAILDNDKCDMCKGGKV